MKVLRTGAGIEPFTCVQMVASDIVRVFGLQSFDEIGKSLACFPEPFFRTDADMLPPMFFRLCLTHQLVRVFLEPPWRGRDIEPWHEFCAGGHA